MKKTTMRKTTMRRIAAAAAAICMCAAALAPVASFAATITINEANNASVAGRTFEAYKVLNVSKSELPTETAGADVQYTYNYTVVDEWKPVLTAYFYAQEYAIRNIRIVIAAKKAGLSPQIIHERIRTSYV